ncbi:MULTISPECIES: 3-isopropylmalate dehydratase large subunit [Rhodopseudomonas]|uniref:3-isopropylmalate dehydratase n=2 Tax=Rhodopseudomonas palustris TaxID=1076 RepID=A0A0D7EGU0_RHOPL|nr:MULTISPECIES: 3-isopropylmalate dehydratase large subunit [Rhodopseudomonas]KIZ39710.1 3-isopropylmalate dehydratase [Rhodopseudomonas palustris]MDF3811599.1 3-isopropylmalate dehydratase large subunit [Rhodopseudomonas sp. BAL398]WOK20665.1 3-isopropylmalate dehydratase large subunit [Rhodopseudomonas sp. BAL398]
MYHKIWQAHEIADLGDGFSLLHVDRHLLHDGSGPVLARLHASGRRVAQPALCFATLDHVVSTAAGRPATSENRSRTIASLREGVAAAGIRLFDVGRSGNGIVHVIGPELGVSVPGAIVVCADSHTCTHGGVGAMGFGIGSTEAEHVLATQTIVQAKLKTMRIRFVGAAGAGISAKDLILAAVGRLGAGGGSGYAVEYVGEAVRALDVEARLTLCNLSIELGAKVGMVAPDATTFAYLEGRPFAPKGELWAQALAAWRQLPSDSDAVFDAEIAVDVASLQPQITWGTSPAQVIDIDGTVPSLAAASAAQQASFREAMDYMGVAPEQSLLGLKVDWVFIGSCTNSRISDLRIVASIVKGRKVAGHVSAWIVPGSETVKRQAEAEGLDRIFIDSGFAWREPGCSLCLAANGEAVPPGARAVSTSNRNFVGRQGPGARTHLASPAVAAASAIRGAISDFRQMGD